MMHVRIKVRLTLIGPILTQSTAAGRMGLDAVMARTSAGHPYLPYSLIRGKLRQAIEELADPEGGADQLALDKLLPFWFGPRRDSHDTDQERGALNFTDFVHPFSKDDLSTRTRIRIDSDTGAAQEKMIMVLDSPFQIGEEATFEGEVWAICNSSEQAELTVKYVLAGLRWIRQIGAERTTGFGRVQSVEPISVKITELTPHPFVAQAGISNRIDAIFSTSIFPTMKCSWEFQHPTALQGTRFLFRIRPRGLFCFGGRRTEGNLFESEEIIPGGAILGILSTMWQQASNLGSRQCEVKPNGGKWDKLAEHFSSLAFSHAFPSPRGSSIRPCAIPLSLVAAEPWKGPIPEKLYDIALCTTPRLIPGDDAESFRPPVFQSDWKKHVVWEKARTAFGWNDIERELRVRTSIDTASLRAAEKKLFAYQMIVPDHHEWLAYLDLSEIPENDRSSVLTELNRLLAAGLGPMGKTKTSADVTIEPEENTKPKWPSSLKDVPDGVWVVTLQTPSVLCSAEDLRDPTGDKLLKGYQATWNQLSGGSLKLRRFFAQQSLTAPRFAGRLPTNSKGQYYPFVVTDAGSTFVLEATSDKATAQAHIENWLRRGLPVREELLGGSPADHDWKRCPYLNRHGYGEISVNPPWLLGQTSEDMPRLLKDELQ